MLNPPSKQARTTAVDGYPDEDPYQHHLSALLLEATTKQWRLPLDECPTGRAILRCRRDLQVKILLAALVRRLWQLGPGCPESVARLFLLNELCRDILRKKLPFEPEQLEATILLMSEPTAASELGKSLLHQVEWQKSATEPVRDALAKVQRVFQHQEAHSLKSRAGQLLSPRRLSVSSSLESPEDKRHWRALLAHARRVPKKLSKRWRGKAKALTMQVGPNQIAERLLPWMLNRIDRIEREETRLLEGIVCACGELDRGDIAEFLDRVATWGYKHRQGKGPRATRLANLSVDALGRMGSTESISFLVALEGETSYSQALKRIAQALATTAQFQSRSVESIRELGIGDPDPLGTIGKRLTRAHSKRLEKLLRTGEAISGDSWNLRFLSSRVLRQLAGSLVWCSADRVVCGLETFPDQAQVSLWHPAEAAPAERIHWKAVLKTQRIVQPFRQVRRGVFHGLPTENSPVLRQYQFAALARERGWRFHLVGRSNGSEIATIGLNSAKGEIQVIRAKPDGPFHRNHTSYEVILLPPHINGKSLRLRHTSEVTRDWNLFCRVAAIPIE